MSRESIVSSNYRRILVGEGLEVVGLMKEGNLFIFIVLIDRPNRAGWAPDDHSPSLLHRGRISPVNTG